MNCYVHSTINSVAACENCKKGVCVVCAVEVDDRIYCRQCAGKLLRQAKKEREAALEKEKMTAKQAAAAPSSAWVGPEPNVKYPASVCYRHPKVSSVAICKECGNGICAACAIESDDGVLCRSCAVIKKPEPVVEEAMPAAAAVPSPAAVSIVALGSIAAAVALESEVIIAPALQAPVEQPVQREVDGVASVMSTVVYEEPFPESYEPKIPLLEPRIPLLLSVIVPGYGQIYNGHLRKGAMLLMVEMAIWILVAALLLRYISGSLWLLLAIACALIMFSGYDAYESALKIKNGQTVMDWFS
jgi:TM2 domain-containing membrane protein YozV